MVSALACPQRGQVIVDERIMAVSIRGPYGLGLGGCRLGLARSPNNADGYK
jgi:hypothetical protein